MLGRLNFVASSLVVLLTVATASADEDQCGLYLAISSTSTVEDTNWGLFAGKDYEANTEIGTPDVAIMMPHLRANTYIADEDEEDEKEGLGRIVDFFEEFFWVPDTAAAKYELLSGRSIAAIPGAGVLAGFYAKMTNADWRSTSAFFRPVQGEESGVAHPNRGANSPFYNIQVVSVKKIKAGAEIFMEYGDSWAEQESKDELTSEDYTRIDETVDQMIAFFDKYKDSLDEDSTLEIYSFLTKDVMKAAVGATKSRRVSALLPPNPADLHKVPEAGGALKFSDPTIQRSADWLQKYGLCMDNIQAGASTIPNAGRGAFATRKIAAGGLVAPVPLTHIPDKDVFDMHKLTATDDGDYVRESDDVVTQQLVLNYCFGHPRSSMVLFPSGAAVALINHSDEPNAKIVWSKHPNHQKMWLELEPETLLDEEHMFIGLMFEIVATRDISPGEEVFIDYGSEWKAAYKKHVEEWNAKVAAGEIQKEWPLRAVDMNARYHTVKPFKTEPEFAKEPYPENVSLKAFLVLQDSDKAGTAADPKVWGEEKNETAYHHDNLFDVTALERKQVENSSAVVPYTYKVQWASKAGKTTVVEGVPHEALVFFDKPGTSDQFVDNAFRHYIGIPDDIFPDAWRNLEE
jgi:SET domain